MHFLFTCLLLCQCVKYGTSCFANASLDSLNACLTNVHVVLVSISAHAVIGVKIGMQVNSYCSCILSGHNIMAV